MKLNHIKRMFEIGLKELLVLIQKKEINYLLLEQRVIKTLELI